MKQWWRTMRPLHRGLHEMFEEVQLTLGVFFLIEAIEGAVLAIVG